MFMSFCRGADDRVSVVTTTRAMTDGSSGSTSSTVTRLAIAAAAVGAAGYAYYLATKARPTATSAAPADPEPPMARPDADDPVAQALADELAEAIEADAKNAETFPQTQTPEEIAELQRQAAVQMARLQAGGNMGQDGAGGMKNLTPEECGGATDRYTWSQTEQEIVVEFPIPKDVTSKRVAVRFDSKSTRVAYKDASGAETVILDGATLREIVPDECLWEIDAGADGGRKVVVTMHKLRATMAMHHWNCVVKGEPTIETERFGPPVVGVNGNDPGAVARMLEDMGR
jgi:hypothetical protein